MATVTATTYPANGILTSALLSGFDILKPQHVPQLMARYGSQYLPMFQWLRGMGREEPVAGKTWFGHEENRYHRTLKCKTNVANPGAGTDCYMTLHADWLDANNRFYGRVNDIVTLPNEVQAFVRAIDVTAPSAPIFRLSPVRAADNIGAIAANQEIAITSSAFADGTGQPDGTVIGMTKRNFYTQLFKETVNIQGGALTEEPWYQVTDDNKNVVGWYYPGTGRGEYYMGLKMDGAFFVGVDNTAGNTNMAPAAGAKGAGNPVYTTKGIVPWIREEGYVQSITTGAYDITDLDTVSLKLRKEGVTSGQALYMVGAVLSADIENAAKTYLAYTGVNFDRVVTETYGGNRELALSVNFGVITKNQMTFQLKVMDQWSNPTTFGAEGYDFEKMGIIIPLTSFKDPKSGMTQMNLATRYRAWRGYSRMFETWTVAGAGGKVTYVTDIDEENTYFRAHVGLQLFKANQMVIQDPGNV
jgi:hypothetical protein